MKNVRLIHGYKFVKHFKMMHFYEAIYLRARLFSIIIIYTTHKQHKLLKFFIHLHQQNTSVAQ